MCATRACIASSVPSGSTRRSSVSSPTGKSASVRMNTPRAETSSVSASTTPDGRSNSTRHLLTSRWSRPRRAFATAESLASRLGGVLFAGAGLWKPHRFRELPRALASFGCFQESLNHSEASEKRMTVAIQRPVVLDRLARVSVARGAHDLGKRLAAPARLVRDDLVDFEAELDRMPRGARLVQTAAHHL